MVAVEDDPTPDRRKANYDITQMVIDLCSDQQILASLLARPWAQLCLSWDGVLSAQGSPSGGHVTHEGAAPAEADQKLKALLERLRQIGSSPSSDPNLRKVLVFSEYADTVAYLHAGISAAVETEGALVCYKDRVAPAVTGAMSASQKDSVTAKFAPLVASDSTPGIRNQYGDYDILVSTDVLAEGLNLQQAGKVINYDMPWNPMRVVQRQGRVDRLGSITGEVETDCFFPAEDTDTAQNEASAVHPDEEDRWQVRSTLRWKLMVAEEALGAQAICHSLPGKGIQVLGASTLVEANDQAYADLRGLGADFMTAQKHAEDHHTVIAGLPSEKRERLSGCPAGVHSCFLSRNVTQPTFVFCVDIANGRREAEVIALCRAPESDTRLQLPTWRPSTELSADRSILLHEVNPGEGGCRAELSQSMVEEAYDAWNAARRIIAGQFNASQWSVSAGGKRMGHSAMPRAIATIDAVAQSRPAQDLQRMRHAFANVHWSVEIVRGVRDTLRNAAEESPEVQYDRLVEYAEVNRMFDSAHYKQPEAIDPNGGATLNSWLLLLPLGTDPPTR